MQANKPVVSPATVSRDGDALVFRGALLRDAVSGLWRQLAGSRQGVSRFDLSAVDRIDSAGLALLAELTDPAPAGVGQSIVAAGNEPISIIGHPQGLSELRAAYRLTPGLSFSST